MRFYAVSVLYENRYELTIVVPLPQFIMAINPAGETPLCPICQDEMYVACLGYNGFPFIDGRTYRRICHACSEVPKMYSWDEENQKVIIYNEFDIERLSSVEDMMSDGWTSEESRFHIKAVKASIKKNLELNCPLCDHACNSETGLKLHVRSKHPKENESAITSKAIGSYKQRQKEFSKNTRGLENYKELDLELTDELACPDCGKKMNSKAGLTLHMKAKHG